VIFTVVVQDPVRPDESGKIKATWFGLHSSNGVEAVGKDPIDALRKLADALVKDAERQAVINEIDAGDDE
jgi:major membrane immunogen (membrane-anchored lipoprotein)